MEQEARDTVYRFNDSPAARAGRLRKEARGTPAGVKRERCCEGRSRLKTRRG